MNIDSLLQDIEGEINDIFNQSFSLDTTDTKLVPNYDSPGLTFERNNAKRGKELTTCVLYIDIRESTKISNDLKNKKDILAKVYTAFAKSMITAADSYDGYIRNIIGDRVMVVFSPENCFNNAINCAITMNTIAHKIFPKYYKESTFKCGIGIDFGNMRVLKVGRPRRDEEKNSFKNLVWLGDTANIASKLTDIASKSFEDTVYKISYLRSNGRFPRFGESERDRLFSFLNLPKTEELTAIEFSNRIIFENNKILIKDSFGISDLNVTSIEKKKVKLIFPPILISGIVYAEFSKLNNERNDIKENLWKIQPKSKYLKSIKTVYGADLTWKIKGNNDR
ncbi:adenylate/guanylate cyclase domain-containing protein [Larkinella sp. C7]|uniref:adenylate/guanylate cyclase domain-containing protein n=1 Tax=Larkinella sp. C7 TaxID=2576607 RepID=UPI00111122FC|nr:adenylate/guanylate cyclase domain-containing protein [Larkinella sp. C7]